MDYTREEASEADLTPTQVLPSVSTVEVSTSTEQHQRKPFQDLATNNKEDVLLPLWMKIQKKNYSMPSFQS